MLDLNEKQKENSQWYKDNLKEILKNPNYKGKHLVIHEKQIVASLDYEHHAIDFVVKKFKSFDECIIQEAIDESEIVNFINAQFQPISNQ